MKKTTYWLFFVLVGMTAGLLSCGDETVPSQTTGDDTVTQNQTETEAVSEDASPRDKSDLPTEYDLNGYEFQILTQTPAADSLCYLVAEEEDGDRLNDAIFTRNMNMMQKYNFTMVETEVALVRDELTKTVLGGDDVYDAAVALSNSNVKPMISAAVLMDLNEITNLNLKKNYWDQNLINSLSVNNKCFFACGDIIVQDNNENLMIMLYSRSLAKSLDMDNMYEVVDHGEWTYDRLISDAKIAANDLNNDNKIDENDIIGYLYADNNALSCHLAACETSLCISDGTGVPIINKDLNRVTNVCDKLGMLYDKHISANWLTIPDFRTTMVTMWSNMQVLYQNMTLNILRRLYRDVTSEFGVLPMPKYDLSQKDYYTTVWRDFDSIVVPVTNDHLEETGFILEALASNSYDLNQEYFDVCLQSKFTRDEESYDNCLRMLDHVSYDMSFIYNFGNFYENINSHVSRKGSEGLISTIEKNRTKFETDVADFFAELNEQ